MKLYIYEHCPFCCRVLMVRGLKQLDLPVEVIMEGDADTPTRMVGRKVVPILRKQDGSHMAESLDIAHYLDRVFAPPVLTAADIPALDDWCARAADTVYRLCVPRFTRADFPELATPEARADFIARETRVFGDLQALTDATPTLLDALAPLLRELEAIVPAPGSAVGDSDLRLFPLLRSLDIVRGATLGPKAQAYRADMLARTGLDGFTEQAQ